MTDLHVRLLARLTEIERMALEPSGHYPGGRQVEGERWLWIRYDDDRPVDHDTAGEYLVDGRALLLASLETYPMFGLRESLPHVPVTASDVEARAGRHIVGNDPRTVIRHVRAFRRIVERHRPDPAEPYPQYTGGGQSCVECSCPASRDGSDCYQSTPYPCGTLLDVAYALFGGLVEDTDSDIGARPGDPDGG